MQIKKNDWFSKEVIEYGETLEGNCKFINYMCITVGNDYQIGAVFKAKTPNVKKGHKKYVILFSHNNRWYITGKTPQQMSKEKWHSGVWCKQCDKVIISMYRHNYVTCGCPNSAMIDGGKDYQRCGGMDLNKVVNVSVNLLNDEIKVDKKTMKEQRDELTRK